MRKAQAAMEFLMTYGWAILVVLVAIGALAYFGVLSPEKFLPEKCVISSGSGLFCDDFAASSSGSSIQLQLHNILDKKVDLDQIKVGTICTIGTPGTALLTIDPDSTNKTTVTGCAMALGSKVKADLTITYIAYTGTDRSTGLSKSTTGQLITTAGP